MPDRFFAPPKSPLNPPFPKGGMVQPNGFSLWQRGGWAGLRAWLLCCCFVLACGLFQPVESWAAKKKKVTINLPQTLILKEFIKIIANETDTVFVYEEKNLRGQMSITAPPNFKITSEDAFFFFEKILQKQGLAMVRRQGSNVVEILPSGDARFSQLPISRDEDGLLRETTHVMRLIRIKNSDLKRIQSTIQPIFSKTGVMLVYDPLDLLIVIDSAENINRLVEIIDVLDVPDPDGLEQIVTVYKLRHNSPAEIHKTITELFSNLIRNGRPLRYKLLIENRLNSLILIANRANGKEILSYIKQLDVPVHGATPTIHELRYGEPGKLVPLISQIFPKTESIKLIPFIPLNALIILANPVTTQEIIGLVNQLDLPRGNYLIKLHRLEYASAKTLAPLLSSIFADRIVAGKGEGKTAPGSQVKIIAESRLNALIIIADRLATERVIKLANQLDVPQSGGGEIQIQLERLRYTSAKVMAPLLSKIFADRIVAGKGEGQATQSSPIKIIEEPRLNALIIIAGRLEMGRVLELVQQLDVFQDTGRIQSNFKLYRLEYAVAEDLAKLLKEMTGQITEVSRNEQEGQAAPPESTKPASGKSEITISADEATNSLLVFAPADTYLTLDQLVEELDVPRMQVYVEALVMEVSLTKSLDLGVKWRAAGVTSSGKIISGGFGSGAGLDSASIATNANSANLGYMGGNTISIGGTSYTSFGAFISATKTDTDVNVLANPQLLMLNNEEATINVSTNTPVGVKTITNANNTQTTQYEFKDVGVKLTIKPQISGEDSIRLEIAQESSNIATEQKLSADKAIMTFKRELKTTVVTGNDDIVVLGGLINEGDTRSESKIPGFGDLPLLGWLFRSSTGKFEKTNLLIFIRPTIIRNRADLARVTERARARYDASQGPQSVSGTVRADMGLKEPEKETPSAGGTEAEAAGATEQP